MASSLLTFAPDEVTVRYKEPYITRGLNAKSVGNTAAGIYRGFRLALNGASLTVTIEADATTQDHVAVYETDTGFSLTLRKAGGDFSVNLSTFANAPPATTVVLALYASYTV